jgi:hypothetical protein
VRDKPYIDAEYEIVSERKPSRPKRWDPLAGLGPIRQLLAVAFMFGGLAVLKWLITPPIDRFVDWLLAASGHR